MSATRDLIAAALRVAGMYEPKFEDEREAVDALRELCARAMYAPDMGEVERLVGEYGAFVVHFAPGDALESLERLNQLVGEKRAALQRLVRGMLAERDELIHDNERLSGLYEQAVKGRADMRSALRDARAAAPQPVSEAEVPMPDVHDYGYHDSDIGWVETLACDESDVRTYGDAREAAGYARGLVEAGKDAERYRYLRNRDAQFVLTTSGPEAGCFIDFEDECGTLVLLTGADADAEIDAALRGEVK